jgi:hypothetical protein
LALLSIWPLKFGTNSNSSIPANKKRSRNNIFPSFLQMQMSRRKSSVRQTASFIMQEIAAKQLIRLRDSAFDLYFYDSFRRGRRMEEFCSFAPSVKGKGVFESLSMSLPSFHLGGPNL